MVKKPVGSAVEAEALQKYSGKLYEAVVANITMQENKKITTIHDKALYNEMAAFGPDTPKLPIGIVAFCTEAFGGKPHSHLFTGGTLMLAKYSGTCPECKINLVKESIMVYGYATKLKDSPNAWHPACFLKAKAMETPSGLEHDVLMTMALQTMGRTVDEMRWRRKAKATCNGYISPKADPTLPGQHKWRCEHPNAPWNLTKKERTNIRQQKGVGKWK